MLGKKKRQDKKRGKQSRKIAAVLVAAAIAAGGFGTYQVVSAKSSSSEESAATVRTAQVTTGTITQTVTGSGTLARADAQDVTVPSGVTIDEVLVSSGDTVVKGQTLATIDETSIKTAISEIQSKIESVDDELLEIGSDTTTETVAATISGRVKKISISSGDDASDVMKESGSLVVISADGLMSVSLPKSTAAARGDTVNVTLSDGSVVTGTVATITGNTMTVTIDDDGPAAGETVSVATAAGTSLGSGTLEVHQPLKVTADSGTVSTVFVSENEEVDAGDTLFTLTGVTDTAAKDQLLSQREDLVDALSDMIALKEDSEIVSPISGTINSVNISAGDEITSSTGTSSGTSTSSSSGSTGTSTGGAASQMSASAGSTTTAANMNCAASSSGFATTVFTMTSAEAASDENVSSTESEEEKSAVTGETESQSESTATINSDKTAVSATITLPVTTPQAGMTPMTADELNAVLTDLAARAGSAQQVSVENMTWNTSTEFTSGTAYRACVTLAAADGYYFAATKKNAYNIVANGSATTYTPVDSDGDGCADTLVVEVEFAETENGSSSQNAADGSGENTGTAGGSISGNSTSGTSGAAGAGTAGGSSAASGASTADAGSAGSSAGGSAGTADASSTFSASASETTDNSYNEYMATVFTVAPDDTMNIDISVDELDILNIKEGQSASLTIDAIDSQTFEGTVTDIDTDGTNSGGSTKYTVTLSVIKDDNMLSGMSVTASIVTDSAENVLTVPASAIQEAGGTSYVYTSEGEDGTLSGKTEVTTGLSDDSTVEIQDGLSEGQTIYYEELTGSDIDTDTTSSQQQMGGGMMGGGQGGPSGDMSGGGGMPQGGGPSGN